jgi:hypothetical protein
MVLATSSRLKGLQVMCMSATPVEGAATTGLLVIVEVPLPDVAKAKSQADHTTGKEVLRFFLGNSSEFQYVWPGEWFELDMYKTVLLSILYGE